MKPSWSPRSSMLVACLLTATTAAGCLVDTGDFVVTNGREGANPAGYFTVKKNASAQLLLLRNAPKPLGGCEQDKSCVVRKMRSALDGRCSYTIPGIHWTVGQAECNYAFGDKFAAQISKAIAATTSPKSRCVRVKVWKYQSTCSKRVCVFGHCVTVPTPCIKTGAKWSATNADCRDGGDLLSPSYSP